MRVPLEGAPIRVSRAASCDSRPLRPRRLPRFGLVALHVDDTARQEWCAFTLRYVVATTMSTLRRRIAQEDLLAPRSAVEAGRPIACRPARAAFRRGLVCGAS